MDWIRVDVAMVTGPKVRKLARRLGCSRHEAAGLVLQLWSWTALSRERGDLSGLDDEDLAVACDWDGDPEKLTAALVGCKVLDRSETGLSVHDWLSYQGPYLHARERKSSWQKERRGVVKTSSGRRDDAVKRPPTYLPTYPPTFQEQPDGLSLDGLCQAVQSKRLQAKDAKAKGDERNAHRLAGEADALEAKASTLR